MTVNNINEGILNRASLTPTVSKQTQGSTFGEKVYSGVHAFGSTLAQGASMLGGPAANIFNLATSGVTSIAGGGRGGAASASYAASGVIGLGGGSTTSSVGGTPLLTTGAGTTAGPDLTAGTGFNGVGQYDTSLAAMSAQNAQMLQVQMTMQRENTMFTSLSNVLKTKHDTAKNSIGNIR